MIRSRRPINPVYWFVAKIDTMIMWRQKLKMVSLLRSWGWEAYTPGNSFSGEVGT